MSAFDAGAYEDLRRRAEAVAEERRREREAERRRVPREALLWLALAPLWTDDLAERAGFPSDGTSPGELLSRLADIGVCTREQATAAVEEVGDRLRPAPTSYVYWMTLRQRRGVIEEALEKGSELLPETLCRVAERVLPQRPPGLVERWAELAAAGPGEDLVYEALFDRVQGLLHGGNVEEARGWVDAARALELPLQTRFAAQVARLQRRIELHRRLQEDRRELRDFVQRDEQDQAFHDLVAGERAWALHYAGVGGVGKTTFLRHLNATLALDEKVVTATVDFDYLTPDYPLSKPAELLAQFADELRLHDPSGAAASEFDAFDDRVKAVHDRLASRAADALARTTRGLASAAEPRTGAPTAAEAIVGADELAGLIEAFARALEALHRRVVPLLDTTEELARLRPDDSATPAVAVTFDILERLHARLPTLRVVFCGRRALASRGAGWRAKVSRQDPRPYLLLHEVRGFDHATARRYLEEKNVPEPLGEAILERLGERDDRVRFLFDEGGGPDEHVLRYNPYELTLYSEWACDPDSPATVEQILDAKTDPYLAARVLGPLQDRDRGELIMTVAILGRFDRDMLAAVRDVPQYRSDAEFRWLAEVEWVDSQPSGWNEVQRALRPRILRYLRQTDPERFAAHFRALLPRLEQYVAERPLSELNADHLAAVARLIAPDPERAWKWWHDMERRFATFQDWSRAVELTSRLLKAYDADAEPELATEIDDIGPLAAYVRATYAAALAQVTPGADAATEWAHVGAWVEKRPRAPGADVLRLRARAGIVASASGAMAVNPAADADRLRDAFFRLPHEAIDEQLAAATVAALAVLVDNLHPGTEVPVACATLVDAVLAAEPTEPLAAYVRALRARLLLVQGRADDARREYLAAAALQEPRPTRPKWLDWQAPDDIGSRVRLEFAAAGFEPQSTLEALRASGGADPPTSTVEGRWLRAAMLRLELALSWQPPAAVLPLAASYAALDVDEPRARVHREVPPLALALAAGLSSSGLAEAALDSLAAVRRRAEGDGATNAAAWSDLVALRILARMRLRDETIGATATARQAMSLEEQKLLWEMDGLDGPKATSLFAPVRATERPLRADDWPAWRHARWRSLYAVSGMRARDAVAWAALALTHERLPHVRSDAARLACALDAKEANMVAQRIDLGAPCLRVFEPSDLAAVEALADAGATRDAFILALRWSVLGEDDEGERLTRLLAARLGARRAGHVALAEAEMLALRLPDRAVRMLEQARHWLARAHDPLHATIASAVAGLTLARAGNAEGARIWIARTREDYRRLSGFSELGLPPLQTLEAVVREPTTETLDALGPLHWRPWLVRIVALLAWAEPGAERRVSTIAEWVAQHYGAGGPALSVTPEFAHAGAEAAVPVPAELEGWMGQTERLERPAARPSALAVAAWSVGPTLLFLVAFVALTWGIGAVAGDPGWHRRVAGIVVALGLVFVTVVIARRVALHRSTVLVDVLPAEPLGSSPAYHGRYSVRLSGIGPRLLWWELPTAAARLRATASVNVFRGLQLEDGARELTALRASLGRLPAIPGGQRPDIALVIVSSAAWVPWEAMLGFSERTRSVADVPYRFRRVPIRGRFRSVATNPGDTILTLAPGLAEAEAGRGWSRATGLRHDLAPLEEVYARAPDPRVRVLHVMGSLSDVASGVRVEAGETLLRSADLAKRFPRLDLCVLQGAVIPSSRMTGRDREQAGLIRSFGAELAEHGVPVLALPPLEAAVARDAVRAVANRFDANHRLDKRLLQRAVRDAQKAIAPGRAPDRDRLEAALQICLYTAGDLHWVYRLLAGIAFEPILVSRIPGEGARGAQPAARSAAK